MKRWLLALGACGQPVAKPVPAVPPSPVVVTVPADAPAPTQEERLAAIQKAMNDLKGAAQQCWAQVAAAERFDVEGALEATIDIGDTGTRVDIASDTTRAPKLVACMQTVLARYAWAPPLRGQTIRLPFKWTAPDGQNVISRALVPWAQQGKISIAVLMDENTTGNAAASMFEVGIEPGATTGLRRAERAELWYFRSAKPGDAAALDVVVSGGKLAAQHVKAGDMLFVPTGAVREIAVTGGTALRAVLVIVPGGREGTARSGALPTPAATTGTGTPVVIAAAAVKRTGIASIYVDATTIKGAPLAASIIQLAADAAIPEHVHAHETELLYTWSQLGADTAIGTLTVAGVAQVVTDHSVIQIPPNTKHAYAGVRESFALQIYTPAGPEQRHRQGSTK